MCSDAHSITLNNGQGIFNGKNGTVIRWKITHGVNILRGQHLMLHRSIHKRRVPSKKSWRSDVQWGDDLDHRPDLPFPYN